MPKLVVISGPDQGKEFPLTMPQIAIGRHSGNPIVLQDNQISRRHLQLRATPEGRHELTDLGSGNGTLVNDILVTRQLLHPGDRIRLGGTILLYTQDDDQRTRIPSSESTDRTDRVRLSTTNDAPFTSAIIRTIQEDAGSQILAYPQRVTTDWLRTRLANLAVLYEATTAVSYILDVNELLARVSDLVLKATDADHVCFMLKDAESGHLQPQAARSRAGAATEGEIVVSRTIVDHVLTAREGVLISDAPADERFQSGESIIRHKIREVICVPMRGRHETVGVLFLDVLAPGRPGLTESTTFTEDHLQLAVAIAHQAALAIEETRYYQALLNSERLAAVGQTIAALSHHIKNIMQGVRFGSDMVRMGLSTDDRDILVKGWNLVERNQVRIDELILDMLSYSKERQPAIELCCMPDVLEDVLELLRGRAQEQGTRIDVELPEGLPMIPCDSEGIHRAMLNVISNALDALVGQDNPAITIRMSIDSEHKCLRLEVSDNGPGIPMEKYEEIFKPFISTKGSRGTGLGLPVSRKILREHGGDLRVQSQPEGGAQFLFELPLEAGGPTG